MSFPLGGKAGRVGRKECVSEGVCSDYAASSPPFSAPSYPAGAGRGRKVVPSSVCKRWEAPCAFLVLLHYIPNSPSSSF